jgi:hypothetical protein
VVLLLALAVSVPGFAPSHAAADVLISELCDPHLNYLTDRFIEIYNSGTAAVDLTGWSLVAMGNGVEEFTWQLSGSIDPGEALVAGDQTTVTVFPVAFPEETWSGNNGNWNGKVGDGAKLLNAGSAIIDYGLDRPRLRTPTMCESPMSAHPARSTSLPNGPRRLLSSLRTRAPVFTM